ncbi:type II CAAX endopeptidase family protein [Thermohalobacter berrensis]|uniref:CAAX prenyl protease 2/Lysostaphin resistance protein A-like domain-containing protein n=1 Tax=Thermohalobacter berrensis TaxID=99594 RepID=A0A419T4S7_9FIRM|nr:type II CAAX endopeptidase family protein [Thermohalobacter berrensis]RKD32433.1 hypothetical protein BET03_10985 [Thermohalobacter berrensis]
MNEVKSKPLILESNIFYLTIGILLLTLGAFFQMKNLYSGFIITEYLIIFLPTVLYLKFRGYSLKKVLRLNRLTFKETIIIPLITLCAYPVGAFLNTLMMIFISLFGEIRPLPIPPANNGKEFLINFLIIALSAGICEEVMFRGMIMNSYERLGNKKAIIFSGMLFGFFHFNIQNLLGPIFLGLLFGYIVYKTNSIYSSVLAHTTNNTIALFLSFIVNKMGIAPNPEISSEITQNFSNTMLLIGSAFSIGIIAVISGVFGYLLLKILSKDKNDINATFETSEFVEKEKLNFVEILPLAIVFIGFLIITIIRFM